MKYSILTLALLASVAAPVAATEFIDRDVEQVIQIFDSSSGRRLYEKKTVMSRFSVTGLDRVANCLATGVVQAKQQLVPQYRQLYPFAFANINCRWINHRDDLDT